MTYSEIRQKLLDEGYPTEAATKIASILRDDVDRDTPPVGTLFDTLRARGYSIINRFGFAGRVIRFGSNGSREILIITNNTGMHKLFAEADVSTL